MKKIVNVGSINIDHVYQVDHIVRGGETLSSLSMTDHAGGKGMNQSVALARAGANVFHVGKVGADGEKLIDLMRESGVNVDYVKYNGSVTGHTVIQVDRSGQNCILLCSGANGELTEKEIQLALSEFSAGDILLLQNEVNLLPYIMEVANNKGMEIAINPSPIGPELWECPLEHVRWFLLNEIEGAAFTGEMEPQRILQAMHKKYPQANVVLTIGEAGVLYTDGEQSLSQGIYKVKAVDTTAAGDTFTGFFLSAILSGKPAQEALRIASKASAMAVQKAGAVPSIPTLQEVLASDLSLS